MAEQKDQKDQKDQKENDIPKSSLTSPVTTDMENTPEEEDRAAEAEQFSETDPLIASGIVLVKVDGIDKRYVGLPPAIDTFNELPSGLKVHPENSVVIGISQVPFSNSIEVKDPTTGEFYYPADGVTSWQGCELNGAKLIPDLPPPPPEADALKKKKGASKGEDEEDETPEAAAKRKEEEKRKAEDDKRKKEEEEKRSKK